MLQSNQPYDPNEINRALDGATSPLAAGAAATALTAGVLGAKHVYDRSVLTGMKEQYADLSDREGSYFKNAVEQASAKDQRTIDRLQKQSDRISNLNTKPVGDILDGHGRMMNNMEKRTGQNRRVEARSQLEKQNLYASGNHEAFQSFTQSEEAKNFNQRQHDRVTRGQRVSDWKESKLSDIATNMEQAQQNLASVKSQIGENFDTRQQRLQTQIERGTKKVGWKSGAIQAGVALGVGAFAAGGAHLLDEY